MQKEDLELLIETTKISKSNTKRLNNVEENIENINNLKFLLKEIVIEIKLMKKIIIIK